MNDYREYSKYTEIYHHGIKGQRWGIRRYQNSDGSLTSAGRSHYDLGSPIKDGYDNRAGDFLRKHSKVDGPDKRSQDFLRDHARSHNSSDKRSAGDVVKGVAKEAWKDRKNIVKGAVGEIVIGAAAGVTLGVVGGIVMSKAAKRGMLDADVNKLGHTIIETGKLATKVALGASSAVGTARSVKKYYDRSKENR